jgi:hypothetical protein
MHRCTGRLTLMKTRQLEVHVMAGSSGIPVFNGALHHRKYFSSTIAFTILECSAHAGVFLPVLARIVQATVDHSAAEFYLRFRSPLHLRRPLAGACLL